MRSALPYLCSLLLAALAPGPAHADAEIRIGAGAGCSPAGANIQAAIDAAAPALGVTRILIARNAVYNAQQLDINGKDLELIGGYADCLQASADTTRTVLNGAGGGSNSVITIRGATSGVALKNLDITGGDEVTTTNGFGGGIDISGGPHPQILIENVRIRESSAGWGGAISVKNGAPSNPAAVNLVLAKNNLITLNTAIHGGGGIFCADSTISMIGANSTINQNSAGTGSNTAPGGGVRLENCVMHVATRSPVFGTITGNTASGPGGGVSITGPRARMDLYELAPDAPTTIANNTAGGLGGGIDIGSSAKVVGFDVVIADNISRTGGGGVSVFDNDGGSADRAELVMQGTLSGAPGGAVNCAPTLDCNRISGNLARTTAGADRSGAAIRSNGVNDPDVHTTRVSVQLYGTRLDHNAGHNLLDNVDLLSDVLLDGTLIDANTVSADLLYNAITPLFRILGSTIAGNTIGAAVLRTAQYPTLRRDIVWQPGVALISQTNGTLDAGTVQYMLSNSLANAPSDATNRIVNAFEVGFVNAAAGNYRLQPGSIALDYAPTAAGNTRDRFARSIDIVQDADQFGPQDVGAYEKQSADGFNSAPAIEVAGAVTMLEDQEFVFLQGFSLSDPDGDIQGALTVTAPPGTGALQAFYFAGVNATQIASNQVVIDGPLSRITSDTAEFDGITEYFPPRDLFGTVSIDLALSDQGNSGFGGAQVTHAPLVVEILPVNDAPTLAIADVIRAQGVAGTQFENLVPSSSVVLGPSNESTQAVARFVLAQVGDPQGVLLGAPTLSAQGVLGFNLSGVVGTADLDAVIVDDGGTANGGHDTSAPARFHVRVVASGLFADGFE